MPENSAAPLAASPPPAPPAQVLFCPVCHEPTEARFYFCPNCGTSLRAKPLSISIGVQIWIYAFSIILPIIAFIMISRWPGVKYIQSSDAKVRQVGFIAAALLAISTIVTFWLAIVWIQGVVQQSLNGIGNLGGLGGY